MPNMEWSFLKCGQLARAELRVAISARNVPIFELSVAQDDVSVGGHLSCLGAVGSSLGRRPFRSHVTEIRENSHFPQFKMRGVLCFFAGFLNPS
jgi:hypothetical protein